MYKTVKYSTIYFLSLVILLLRQHGFGQTVIHDKNQTIDKIDTCNISGNYEGVICFRTNECCTTKLFLKKNHEYKMTRKGNNHGRKNKWTEQGNWTFDGEILVLTEKNNTNSKQPEPEKYKVINSDLWYYSLETLEPTEIAVKRK